MAVHGGHAHAYGCRDARHEVAARPAPVAVPVPVPVPAAVPVPAVEAVERLKASERTGPEQGPASARGGSSVIAKRLRAAMGRSARVGHWSDSASRCGRRPALRQAPARGLIIKRTTTTLSKTLRPGSSVPLREA